MDNTQSFFFSDIKATQQVPNIIDYKSSRGYILFGKDNKLPDFIWDTYLHCSDLQSLVQTTVDYILGSNLDVHKPEYLLTKEHSYTDLLQKCIFDYILFGGFALEGIRNAKGELVRLNYINVQNVRVNEDLTQCWLSSSWGSWTAKDAIVLPLYASNETQDHFIYYYRGAITRNIYPVSIWFSALKSAIVLNCVRDYNLNNIQNNFSANVLISLNGTSIKQKELEEMKDKLTLGYTGNENAGKTLIINNANSDGKVEVTRLDSDKASDLYKNVADSSIADLQRAFRINPILVGENVSTGFSKQEFQQAFALYNATVIRPLRNNIISVFKLFNIDINFNDIEINWYE